MQKARIQFQRSKVGQFMNPKNNKFKILLVVIAVITVVLIIMYFVNKRKWDKLNPIFFKKSILTNRRITLPGEKIYTSTIGNSFTYFFWLYVDDIKKYRYGVYKNVFTKGHVGYYSEKQCPGIYIAQKTNDLEFILSTESSNQIINEKISLHDFPMRKWFSIALIVDNNSATVCLDGKVAVSKPFGGAVMQNKGNLVVGGNGGGAIGETKEGSQLSQICKKSGFDSNGEKAGFGGMLSSLCYFPEAKSIDFIEVKHKKGPYTEPAFMKLYRYIRNPRLKIEEEEEED
tara:strand:- start:1047 stop:1907 length:861 start_codon:yes stop_codon:yes gene_type:complete